MEKVGNGKKRTKSQVVLTVVGIVLCCILIPMLVLNLTIIIKGTINPDTPPSIFGVVPLAVLSGSMEPEILIGDMILVSRVEDATALSVDDVISFTDGEAVVTHRIIELVTNEDGDKLYRTRGDNNNTEDRKLVDPSTVIGVYKGTRFAGLGNLVIFMQKPVGIVIFVGVPVILFIVYDILRRRAYDNARRKELEFQSENQANLQAELARLQAELNEKATSDVAEAATVSNDEQRETEEDKTAILGESSNESADE